MSVGDRILKYAGQVLALRDVEADVLGQLVGAASDPALASHLGLRFKAAVRDMRPAAKPAMSGRGYRESSGPMHSPVVDGLAVVNIQGPLDKYTADVTDSDGNRFGTSYEMLAPELESLAADSGVSGVLLRVDSPGGAAMGLSQVAAAINTVKAAGKPVVAVSDDLNASAALYLSSQADELLVTEGSWTGSIGTIVIWTDNAEALKQRGVRVHVVKSAELKDAGASYRAPSAADVAVIQEEVNTFAAQFKAAVAAGRRVGLDVVERWADGRGFIGPAAVEAGLANGVVTDASAALSRLRELVDQRTRGGAARVALPARGQADKGSGGGPAGTSEANMRFRNMIGAGMAILLTPGGAADPAGGGTPAPEPGNAGPADKSDGGVVGKIGAEAEARRRADAQEILSRSAAFAGNPKISALKDKALSEGWTADKFSAEAFSVLATAAPATGHVPGGGVQTGLAVEIGTTGEQRNAESLTMVYALKLDGGIEQRLHGENADRVAESMGFKDAPTARLAVREAKARLGKVRTFQLAMASVASYAGVSLAEAEREFGSADKSHVFMHALSEQVKANQLKPKSTHSTSDFPLILSNAMNKVLQSNPPDAATFWETVCAVATASDYKDQDTLFFSGAQDLLLINEGQVAKLSTLNERRERTRVQPYARGAKMTYQMIRNDDLGAFSDLLGKFARSAARLPDALLATALAQNGGLGPVMSDNKTFFHADHGNIGTPAALGYDALRADFLVLEQQKDEGKDAAPLELSPHAVLVAKALKWLLMDHALQEYRVGSGGAPNERNAIRGLFIPLSTARLSGTRRYIFADPNVSPAFKMYFLDGQRTANAYLKPQQDPMSLEYQFTLPGVGLGVADYKAAVTNAGQ